MKIKLLLLGAVSAGALATASLADSITVVSWGGGYTKSQVEAYHKPWAKSTGNSVVSEDYSGGLAEVRAQVEAGNVSWDVVDVELSDAIVGCDEGLLEEIDASTLPDGLDGTPASEDFMDGALSECAVGNIVWSTMVAYDKTKFSTAPTTMADFFDLENFPGKRGMRKVAKNMLEMALMGDGVPASGVYDVMKTDEGIDRAFAKLDCIKLKEAALDFVRFSTSTQPLADQASWIPYGPTRASSIPLLGTYHSDASIQMIDHMPTTAQALKNGVQNDYMFWADNGEELNERFNAWLAK